MCDIKPGALLQSYSVQWFRMIQSVLVIHEGKEGFELTLNVTPSLNGSQHLCVVTVNHDGNISQNYSGGITTIQGMSYSHISSAREEFYMDSKVIMHTQQFLTRGGVPGDKRLIHSGKTL